MSSKTVIVTTGVFESVLIGIPLINGRKNFFVHKALGEAENSEFQVETVIFQAKYASSGTTAQTSKGSYLGRLPLWPTGPLYHCGD
ncbi:hypothetical protein TNCV_99551 [Trichonephila clavipes]|nr:hypothetical protein TNCV_99551 [Trichonephila clavipes]